MQLHELLQNFQGSETLVQSYLRLLIVGQLVENLSFNFVLNIYLIHKKKILGFFFIWLINFSKHGNDDNDVNTYSRT